MKKQVIEIEVPDGKKAVWENGAIKFVPEGSYWKSITTFNDALFYVMNYLPECEDLLNSYTKSILGSYEHSVVCYRIVVAALTNNEKRHLTTGDKWYPVVQFCRSKDKRNCWGDVLIGTIESEGEKYSVMGGRARFTARMRVSVISIRLTACRILMRISASGRFLPRRLQNTSQLTLVSFCLKFITEAPTVIGSGSN